MMNVWHELPGREIRSLQCVIDGTHSAAIAHDVKTGRWRCSVIALSAAPHRIGEGAGVESAVAWIFGEAEAKAWCERMARDPFRMND